MLPCAEACLCCGLMDGLDKCSSPPLPEGKVETQRGEDGAACLSAELLAFGAVCSVTVRLSQSTPNAPKVPHKVVPPFCCNNRENEEGQLCGRLPRGRPP